MSPDWKPTADIDALRLRAALYALIRTFFSTRDVLEMETPILSAAGNTDPNIASFCLNADGRSGQPRRWLRTSPEFALKRMLAAGVGDCYELGRVFRLGETGRNHNPEFSMLEWYRVGWDHRRLMREVAELVTAALTLVGRGLRVRECSYRDLYRDMLGLEVFAADDADDDATLRAALGDIAIDPSGLRRDDWLDLLMTHRIQPQLRTDELLLVYDYPASQCALAKVRDDSKGEFPVAERFEAYLGPLELANGYHELTDASEQHERFQRDLRVRRQRSDPLPAIDEQLLAALESGLPQCAGVALGVERLLMAMSGAQGISGVIAFPFDRA
jgi:lysyl-tRNA synthetase class 2